MKVIIKSSKKHPGEWYVRKGYRTNKYFPTWDEALKYALTLLSVLLLFCLPAHARSSVDRQYVTETVAELKDAALLVGRYEHVHHSGADALFVQRAEADITVAKITLDKYRHHSAAKQDVESVMSQLSRDLEDMPPSLNPIPDVTSVL